MAKEHPRLIRSKSVAFVKTQIKRLPREDESWEVDFRATSPDNLVRSRKDTETLIERKLQMFPDDRRQIVSTRIVVIGKDLRIEVASATLQ